ncbi:unnamed protein product [Rotaria sp. Silwood1]|nr:unnamed protein product [Rotaria sp. Silwood1]CAF1659710.1 unnamed protein product [Rotaria sp. Silwood1]
MEELNFEHTSISMYGKPVNLPRLQSWFAEEGLVVKELFQKQKQHIWTVPMRKLKAQLEKQLGVKFAYCLVNLYRNGNDYINFHADNEAKDIIASISLGATRKFLVRHLSYFGKDLTRKRKPLTMPDKKEYEFSLNNGSLIVMLDGTQQYWKHSVPKEKKILPFDHEDVQQQKSLMETMRKKTAEIKHLQEIADHCLHPVEYH